MMEVVQEFAERNDVAHAAGQSQAAALHGATHAQLATVNEKLDELLKRKEAPEPAAPAPAKRAKAAKVEPGFDELSTSTFIDFSLAMAYETLQRIGKMQPADGANPFMEKLPERVQGRFKGVQRCSYTWATDRTSLALAAGLLAEPDESKALRMIVVAQCLVTDAADFSSMAGVVNSLTHGPIRKMETQNADGLLQHLQKVAGRRKSLMNPGLQTGMLSAIGASAPGSVVLQQTAIYLAGLNQSNAFTHCIEELRKPETDAVTQLQKPTAEKGLELPAFRAQCVARFLHFYTKGELGASPTSCFVGDGAQEALNHLCKLGGVEGLADAAASWDKLFQEADSAGVLDALKPLNLQPTPQTWEHLLCEARKVFGKAARAKRGKAREGLLELFEKAASFFALRAEDVVEVKL